MADFYLLNLYTWVVKVPFLVNLWLQVGQWYIGVVKRDEMYANETGVSSHIPSFINRKIVMSASTQLILETQLWNVWRLYPVAQITGEARLMRWLTTT